MSDHDLLRRYADEGSESAFATLVDRHLNLVYSAARRQVRSPQLAEEVAQSVFIDLAQNARRLGADTPLAAWLHLVTRRTAIDAIRRESRRATREQQAAGLETMKPESPDWSAIEPLLDEAVESLSEPDRTAVLLRFFENKSLREVGAALGTTDDAAQKRVTRALDQLRTFFHRRGITVTATGLATDLTAAAIHPVPATLAATIGSAVTSSTVTTAAHTAGIAAMTTLQKSLVAVAFTLTTGACLFQAVTYARQDATLSDLRNRTAELQRQLTGARREHTALTGRLAATDHEIDERLTLARQNVSAVENAAVDATLTTWVARARRLRSFAAAHPDLTIPEFRLLTDEHWAEIAAKSSPDADGGSDTALKAALTAARRRAENIFAPQLQRALKSFLQSSGDVLPDSLYQLLPHFEPPISPELFSRYRLTNTGRLGDVAALDRGTFLLEIEASRVIDQATDNIVSVGLYGIASHSANVYQLSRAAMKEMAARGSTP